MGKSNLKRLTFSRFPETCYHGELVLRELERQGKNFVILSENQIRLTFRRIYNYAVHLGLETNLRFSSSGIARSMALHLLKPFNLDYYLDKIPRNMNKDLVLDELIRILRRKGVIE